MKSFVAWLARISHDARYSQLLKQKKHHVILRAAPVAARRISAETMCKIQVEIFGFLSLFFGVALAFMPASWVFW